MTQLDRLRSDIRAALCAATGRFNVDFRSRKLRVISDDDNARAILDHTLGTPAKVTAMTPSDLAAGDWTVAILASDRIADFAGAPPVAKAIQDGLGLTDYWRGDFSCAPLVLSAQRALVRHREPFDGLTFFDRGEKLIVYLHPRGTRPFIPHCEHLVTYVARATGWRRGYLDVHAAFLRYRGKGLALLGKRQAGKTSLAMHFLQRGGDLLGSDMAQIRLSPGGGILADAIPHMCRITPETVRDNALLSRSLGSHFDDNRDYLCGPLHSHGKYELYESSLDRVFGREVCIASMTVDALMFPNFAVETETLSIVSAPDEVGKLRLLNSVEKDRPLFDWLPFEEMDARSETEAAARDMLAGGGVRIKSYDVGFGRERSLDWHEIDAVVERI